MRRLIKYSELSNFNESGRFSVRKRVNSEYKDLVHLKVNSLFYGGSFTLRLIPPK